MQIYYTLIIAFHKPFFNAQNNQIYIVEISYFVHAHCYATPSIPAYTAESISISGMVSMLAMVDKAKWPEA